MEKETTVLVVSDSAMHFWNRGDQQNQGQPGFKLLDGTEDGVLRINSNVMPGATLPELVQRLRSELTKLGTECCRKMGEDNDKHPHELNNVVVIFVYTCNEFVYHEKSKVKVKLKLRRIESLT